MPLLAVDWPAPLGSAHEGPHSAGAPSITQHPDPHWTEPATGRDPPTSKHREEPAGWLAQFSISFRSFTNKTIPNQGAFTPTSNFQCAQKSVRSPSSIHVDSCMNSYAWPLFLNTSVEQWHVANRHPLIVVPPLHDTARRVWHEHITPT